MGTLPLSTLPHVVTQPSVNVASGAAEELWLHHWATLLRIFYGADLRTVIDKV